MSTANKILMGASEAGGPVGPSDDEFNRVSFLSHFEGANNGVNNQFTDGSASNHTITANGNVTQGSFGPFARPDGEWGVSFDGAGDYLDVNDGVTFGTGAFTIEFFVYLNKSADQKLFDARPDGVNTTYPVIYTLSNNTIVYYANSGVKITSSETLSENAWYHVAVCRSGTSTKMFLDGTQVGSTYSDSTNYADSGRMRIGASKNATNTVEGYMSNVRVVNSALYTSNFTAPTTKLTAVTNTKLLTCQSNRFVDNSASPLTITPVGNPAVSAFGPFLPKKVYNPAVNGASAYFDHSASTYLSAADSADWDFGNGNYTVEFWMYVTSSGVYQAMLNHWADFSGNDVAWSFEINTSNRLAFLFKIGSVTALTISSSPGDYLNQWVHVAAVRNSNVHTVYLNGVSKDTTTNSGTMNNCTDVLRVGAYFSTYGFDGYICDSRIVKGTAVYTGNFTPPTAPLTAITNTKMLLNMADGQAIDSAAQNNLTLEAQAKISTAQAKFGDSSFVLRGTSTGDFGKCIIEPFGTGNFTVECFVRINDKSDNQGFFQIADGWANSAVKGPALEIRSGRWRWFYGNGGNAWHPSAGPASNNTWYHIAFVRNGTTSTFYADGTSVLTASDSTNYTWGHLAIGVNYDGNYWFGGYIDEFRISRMARYTSNFTPATEPFADKGQ